MMSRIMHFFDILQKHRPSIQYTLGYTHTWDGSVQVGVAKQLEQRGKLGLAGIRAPNLAQNLLSNTILRLRTF